jgi:hypothetical protein
MTKKPPTVPPVYDEGAYGASLVARSLPVAQVQALTPAENKSAEAPVRRRLVLSPRMKDVTHQHRGKLFAIVGVPVRKRPEEEEEA